MFASNVKKIVKEYLYGSMFDSNGKAVSHDNVSNLVDIIFDDIIDNAPRDKDGNIVININSYSGVIKKVI